MGLTPERSDNDRTLATYEANARTYVEQTSTERRGAPAALLELLAGALPSGQVLEIGSGPGTDADSLEERGLVVDRTDAARAFVDLLVASGRRPRVLNVLTDDLGGPYDAVLANAVLLHLSRPDLSLALTRTAECARAGGLALALAALLLGRFALVQHEPALSPRSANLARATVVVALVGALLGILTVVGGLLGRS